MKKHGMLNSSITKVLADLGHTDWLVIADAGLPVPKGVPKIDLALTPGTPSFKSVVKAVCDDMVIEKVIAAEEVKDGNPDQLAFLNEQFPNLIAFVPHEDLKKMIEKAKAVIRTGEMTAYSNCILQAGVFF